MEQIAERVDIARGTLYNYFPVKEAILDEYIRRSFQEKRTERLQRVLDAPDTRTRLARYFEELLSGVQARKEIFERYVAYRMRSWVSFQQNDVEGSGFFEVAAEIVRMGQQAGEIRTDQDFETVLDL